MTKRRLIWLAALAVLLGAYYALTGSRPVMNAISDAAKSIKRAAAACCSLVRFSVGEIILILSILAVLFYLVFLIVTLIRNRRTFFSRILLAIDVVLSVLLILNFTFGASFHADGFCEKSGLTPRGGTVKELYTLTEKFTDLVNSLAPDAPRDENNRMKVSADEILERAEGLYDEITEEFPCLSGPEVRAKKLILSRVMSAMGYTGIFFPFTGEANVNVDFPPAFLPDTVAHELAHQRGAASEDEANFVGIVASLKSNDSIYQYSGALSAWSHLGNALYQYDHEAYFELYRQLDPMVQADILASNEYWAAFESPVTEVSEAVYDSFLKSYGETDGVKTYGEVVGLLLAYYA